jgi:hypothetical protein
MPPFADDLGVAIALVALLVSGYTLWRSELRGPVLRVWSAGGSTFVRMGVVGPDRLLVNVYRDVVITNDSVRPGYLGDVKVEPHGSLSGMTVYSLTVGVVGESMPVPQILDSLNKPVERGSPVRLIVSWWLDLAPEDEPAILAQIRAPQGSLAAKVTVFEYRQGRLRHHDLIVRPKDSVDELIRWGHGTPSGVGRQQPESEAAPNAGG